MDGREKAARLELLAFQLSEIEKVAADRGRGRGARREQAGARQRRARAASVRGVLRDAVRQRRGRARGAGECVEAGGRAGVARSAVRGLSGGARRDQVPARGPGALPEALRRWHRRVARAPAAGRGSAGQPRAIEAEVRPVARRGDREGARARSRTGFADGAGERGVPSSRRRSRRRGAVPRRRPASCPARARTASQRFARELERCWPSWRWRRRGSRCGSTLAPLPEEAWTERGIDQAEFFLSPNPGEDLRPLARIVSGGELSRVMLALKTMSVDDSREQDADLRRGGCRHRRASGGRRGLAARRARRPVPGAVHHAPAADRGARGDALPDRQDGATRSHRDVGSTARRCGSY